MAHLFEYVLEVAVAELPHECGLLAPYAFMQIVVSPFLQACTAYEF